MSREPAEEQVVMQLFDEEVFRTHAEQRDEHLGFEQSFGRDGRAALLGIHPVKHRTHAAQHGVHLGFDRANRVRRRHNGFGRNQTNQFGLRFDRATHPLLTSYSPIHSKLFEFFKRLLEFDNSIFLFSL